MGVKEAMQTPGLDKTWQLCVSIWKVLYFKLLIALKIAFSTKKQPLKTKELGALIITPKKQKP